MYTTFLIFKLVFKLCIFRSKNKTFHCRKKRDVAHLGDLVFFALNTMRLNETNLYLTKIKGYNLTFQKRVFGFKTHRTSPAAKIINVCIVLIVMMTGACLEGGHGWHRPPSKCAFVRTKKSVLWFLFMKREISCRGTCAMPFFCHPTCVGAHDFSHGPPLTGSCPPPIKKILESPLYDDIYECTLWCFACRVSSIIYYYLV